MNEHRPLSRSHGLDDFPRELINFNNVTRVIVIHRRVDDGNYSANEWRDCITYLKRGWFHIMSRRIVGRFEKAYARSGIFMATGNLVDFSANWCKYKFILGTGPKTNFCCPQILLFRRNIRRQNSSWGPLLSDQQVLPDPVLKLNSLTEEEEMVQPEDSRYNDDKV